VTHLQISLLLQSLGVPFSEARKERAAVYLTNALTGWEPPDGSKPQMLLSFPELLQERDAAERVKQATPILVILGNPPYNGFAGMGVAEERDLSQAYRTAKRAPKPQGQGLNDLYVRFYRMAERRIAGILLLKPKLDANYEAITRSTYQWPRSEGVSENGQARLRSEA
jgi:hypothetical protein